MLFLTRRSGQSIVIGNDIEVFVDDVKRSSVRFAIRHPAGIEILRRELFDKIRGATEAQEPPAEPSEARGPGRHPRDGSGE